MPERPLYVRIANVSQFLLVNLGTTTDDEVHQVFLQTRSNFHFTGTVTSSNSGSSSFYVEPSFRMPAFPVHCFPSAVNKDLWAQKPLPPLGSLVTVEGYLDQAKRDSRKAVASFEIEVDGFRVFKPPRMGEHLNWPISFVQEHLHWPPNSVRPRPTCDMQFSSRQVILFATGNEC